MDILIVSQYFWPENFRINDLVFEFQKRNHNITVLTGIPSYPNRNKFEKMEVYNKFSNVDLIRIPLFNRGRNNFTLMINYISFFLSGLSFGIYKLKNKNFDVVFVFQPSPIFPVLLGVIIGKIKKCRVCTWVLDLWPETLDSMGFLKNKIIKNISFFLSNFIYGKVELLLTQSSSMRDYMRNRLPKNNIQLLSNWVEKEFSNLESPQIRKEVKKIFFTGNIGESQDFEAIIKCFKILKSEDIILEVLGDGKNKSKIVNLVKTNNLHHKIFFKNPVSLSKLPQVLKEADALLFALKKNKIFEITIPGKFQSYLAFGLPILGMINGESSRIIEEHKIGYSVNAGDYKSLAKKIKYLINSSVEVRKKMSQNAQHLAKTAFDRNKVFDYLEIELKKMKKECA